MYVYFYLFVYLHICFVLYVNKPSRNCMYFYGPLLIVLQYHSYNTISGSSQLQLLILFHRTR